MASDWSTKSRGTEWRMRAPVTAGWLRPLSLDADQRCSHLSSCCDWCYAVHSCVYEVTHECRLVNLITTHDCGVVMRSVASVSVCLSVMIYFWKPWHRKFIFGMQVCTSSESSGQVCTSKSSSQRQKTRNLIPPPSVIFMAQSWLSCCKCSDGKSISVIAG